MQSRDNCQSYKLFQKRRNSRVAFVQTLYVHLQSSPSLRQAFEDVRQTFSPEMLWDQEFYKTLFTFFSKESESLYAELSENLHYDLSRFTLIDQSILIAALTEMCSCPLTDRSIIINEFLEITKEYSEPSSKKIINAILDKLAQKDHSKEQYSFSEA